MVFQLQALLCCFLTLLLPPDLLNHPTEPASQHPEAAAVTRMHHGLSGLVHVLSLSTNSLKCQPFLVHKSLRALLFYFTAKAAANNLWVTQLLKIRLRINQDRCRNIFLYVHIHVHTHIHIKKNIFVAKKHGLLPKVV